ncbi:MAG TPA: hypothetical protein VK619_00315 [Pyrinomonadaceae bacterium]|nr:hypothetical protein [Pyrinomonadaceae bacterium]
MHEMIALSPGFISNAGDEAEALGRLVGFVVGFGLTMLIGIVIVIIVIKKVKKK